MVLQWAWYLNVALTCALVIQLAVNRLGFVYKAFFTYLVCDAMQQLSRIAIQTTGRHATWSAGVYIGGQAVKMVVCLFLVLELYELVLVGHPALARFGRKSVGALLTVAGVAALAGLFLDQALPHSRFPILDAAYLVEMIVDSAYLFFLLLISAFFLYFPIKIRRNVVVYLFGFGAFFFFRWAGLVSVKARLDLRDLFSLGCLIATAGCLSLWLWALRRKGETTATVAGHRWNEDEMERLTGQLDAINAKLLGVNRQ